ncbi:MAG: hypothetical protein ACREA0_32695, partial [bacterium]
EGGDMTSGSEQLRGNRIALVGAIVYLLEWVAIIGSGTPVPIDPVDTKSPSALLDLYAQHATGTKILAGWLALVLVGRIVFAVGVRSAIGESHRARPLMDVAVGVMVVSVALEVGGYGLAGAAAALAEQGSDANVIIALNGASNLFGSLIFAPLGVAVAVTALAMLRSKLFSKWLCWLGLLSGASMAVGGVIVVAALGSTGFLADMSDAPVSGVVLFWVWMLATGVLLFRRAGRKAIA